MRPASALSSACAWPSAGLGLQRELLTRYASPTLSFLSVKTKIGLSAYFYFHGGDGESRTRVRKHFRETFSERSQCFFTSLQPASIDRHKPKLSRCSPVLPGTRTEFSCIFDAGLQGLQVNLSRHAQLMTD